MPSDAVPVPPPPGGDDGPDRLQAATQVERNVFVIAGAGTGKTSLLTARLDYCLVWRAFHHARASGRPQAAVREVVAMTFTEKAAAEMRDRARAYLRAWLYPGVSVESADARFVEAVRRHLYERLHCTESEWRSVLQTLLAYLNEVRISTIHGFCAGVLRAYAFEASVPPEFEVIGDDRWTQVFQEEWLFYLLDLLGHRPSAEPAYRQARKALRWFVRRYHLDLETLSGMARVAAISHITMGHPLDHQVAWEAQAGSAYLRRLRERGFLRAVQEAVGAYAPRRPHARRFRDFLHAYLRTLTDGAEPSRRRPPPDLTDRWGDARHRLQQAAEACAHLLPEARAPHFLNFVRDFMFFIEPELTRRMFDVLAPFLERLQRRFRQEGYLTYDDLLWQTYRLLEQNPTVRQSLQAQIRHVLVDEFQDTNPVQMDILRLIGQDVHTGQWRPGAVFVVGDPKQSIYAFRDADLAAFQYFYEELRASPDFLECVLRQNFRSTATILNFVNTACAPLFEEDRRRYPLAEGEAWIDRYGLFPEAGPEGPTSGSITEFLKRTVVYPDRYVQPPYIPVYPATPGHVPAGSPGAGEPGVVLYCLEGAEDPDDLWARTVVGAVARWGMARQTEGPGVDGECPWSRTAVLFRSMTHVERLAALARRFHERGIPFVVEGDRHFFRKPEVLDVLNMLRVWVNPYDRPALVGWLRSPIVGVSDDFLFHLVGWERERASGDVRWPGAGETGTESTAVLQAADLNVWAQARPAFLERFARLADEWKRAETAIGRLQAHRDRHGQAPPAQVLTSLFYEFRIPAAYATDPTGPQKVTNLWKLVELAYRWFDQGDTTVERWVQRLQAYAAAGMEEGEGLLADPEWNACRWMTIHKAKGLEFDLVVIADAHFLIQPLKTGGAAEPCLVELTPEGRVGVAVRRGAAGQMLYNVTFLLQRLRRNQLEEAEKKRLFYVACTRARERLVLVCRYAPSGGRTGPACRLARCWGPNAGVEVRRVRSAADLPEPARSAPEPPTDRPTPPPQEVYDRVWTAVRKRWDRFRKSGPLRQRPSEHDRVPDPTAALSETDAEGLALWVPTGHGPEASRPHGRWVGTLVHEVLAQIPLDPDGDDLAWAEAFLLQEAPLWLQRARVEDGLGDDEWDNVLEESLRCLRPFLQSSLWRYIKPRIRAREIPFLGPADAQARRFWEGRIDLIVEDTSPHGPVLWVCDYKTDAVPDASTLVRLYRSQLRVYESYIRSACPDRIVQAALVWVPRIRWIPLSGGRARTSRPTLPSVRP